MISIIGLLFLSHTPGNPVAGKEVFLKNCALCHGPLEKRYKPMKNVRNRPKRSRIITQLRADYPDVEWCYDAQRHEWCGYLTKPTDLDLIYATYRVRAEAKLAPRFDGDDDSFEVQYRLTSMNPAIKSGVIYPTGHRLLNLLSC